VDNIIYSKVQIKLDVVHGNNNTKLFTSKTGYIFCMQHLIFTAYTVVYFWRDICRSLPFV